MATRKVSKRDDDEIIFEDAPPTSRGSHRKSKHLKQLDAARANPGKTVKIPRTNTSVAANIRAGKYQGIEAGEFNVVTRQVEPEDGKIRVDVYVTYPVSKTNGKKP